MSKNRKPPEVFKPEDATHYAFHGIGKPSVPMISIDDANQLLAEFLDGGEL